MTAEVGGAIIGFLLTMAVFSYLLGDNPLYRAAVYLLVGVAVGYATIVAIDSVIVPWFTDLLALIEPGSGVDVIAVAPPVLLAVFLLLKISPRTAPYGNLVMAFLVGLGAAVAIGGAVLGTIVPQSLATMLPASNIGFISGLIILVGTVFSLLFFFYGTNPIYFFQLKKRGSPKQHLIIRGVALVGQFFILLTLATLYTGALSSSFTLLGERLGAIRDLLGQLAGL